MGNNNQYMRWPAITLGLGGFVWLIGAVMKILHWPDHELVRYAGIALMIVGIILIVIARVTKK